jgi:hypothetical protein
MSQLQIPGAPLHLVQRDRAVDLEDYYTAGPSGNHVASQEW